MKPSRTVHITNKFDKAVALAIQRGKDTAKLRAAIELRQHTNLCRANSTTIR